MGESKCGAMSDQESTLWWDILLCRDIVIEDRKN